VPTATPTRGQRILENLRTELAHQQRADRIAGARRTLDRLQDQQARLEQASPWSPGYGQRRGDLVVAIRNARQRIAELEAAAETERAFGLQPVLEVSEPVRGRPGTPPTWYLEGPRSAAPTPRPAPAHPSQRRRPTRSAGRRG
jgi:hypothetical protein